MARTGLPDPDETPIRPGNTRAIAPRFFFSLLASFRFRFFRISPTDQIEPVVEALPASRDGSSASL